MATSLCCVAALALVPRWHIGFSGDRPGQTIQAAHARTVPRIGGVGVYLAGLAGLLLLSPQLPTLTLDILWKLWACLSIVFFVGLLEDTTRRISASWRYIAALVAAGLFSWMHDSYGIASVGFDLLDPGFNSSGLRLAFFAFAVASVSHAFNLIDGQNGVCSGVSILVFSALAVTAVRTDQIALAQLATIMAAANLGFFVFNFPLGKIFLGDGGAYFNGAMAAALTVLIVQGAGRASPWLAILILIYPIWETLFSMARRLRARQPFHLADKHHLHHLAAAALSGAAPNRQTQWIAAPLLLSVAPFVLSAPLLAEQPARLQLLSLLFVTGYCLLYRHLARRDAA